MCVAIIKPSGIEIPNESVLKICFKNNPDGAGFAYWRDNKIYVHKGFFTFDGFLNALKKSNIQKEESALIHFRVATHGKVNLENCHPFPIVDKFSKMTRPKFVTTNDVLIHNGKLNIEIHNKNYSDSMHFAQALNEFDRYNNKSFIEHIIQPTEKNKRGNRIGILQKNNNIEVYGVGWINENGILFSNDSFKENSTYKSSIKKTKKIGFNVPISKKNNSIPMFTDVCSICYRYTNVFSYCVSYSKYTFRKAFICSNCIKTQNDLMLCVACNSYAQKNDKKLCTSCQIRKQCCDFF